MKVLSVIKSIAGGLSGICLVVGIILLMSSDAAPAEEFFKTFTIGAIWVGVSFLLMLLVGIITEWEN